jgi:hypothetical protein
MKKKLLLLVVLALTTYLGNAQTSTLNLKDSSTITMQRWRDTSFALLNLSSSQIPSGYLIDYALNEFNDSNFNSVASANIDTITDAGSFFALHNILSASVVNSSATPIGTTDSLFINAYRYKRDHNTIPLLFLYQPFQKIRSTALSQGLMTLSPDSIRLQDVAGRTSSPYDNKFAFGFSPLQNKISQDNSISFALPSQFWMMPGVSSVQVDFGDGGGLRTLSPGSTVSIYYNATGTYYLTAKITVSGSTLTAKSAIQYTQPKTYVHFDSVWNITATPIYTSISNYLSSNGSLSRKAITPLTTHPLGAGITSCSDGSIFNAIYCDINPGATVYIQNGCDNVFDKPIIVVEGFDPTSQTTPFSLMQMVSGNPSSSLDFYDLMRSQGYDFVFVIFTKNLDFIENNAQVLEQVIQRVNATKSGSNKSTVIGYSMGGLIARWALKDMENKAIAHQVANYFSYDSPHQGANVPLGLQCLFNEILIDLPVLKSSPQIGQLYSAFTSYAAQEMLADYASFSGSTINPSPLNPVRAVFAQSLINMGYPQTTNNYAISNGRGNNGSGTVSAGNGTQWGNFLPSSQIFSGGASFILENFGGSVFAVPTNNNTSTIMRYAYAGTKVSFLFGFVPIVSSRARIINISETGGYPYDDAPGGYERAQSQFVDGLNSRTTVTFWNNGPSTRFLNRGFAGPATNLGHFGHDFIPVTSALDLQNQGYGSSNSYQSNNLYYNIDNNIVNAGQLAGNTLNPAALSPFKAVVTYTSDCASASCSSLTFDDLLTKTYLGSPALGNPLVEPGNWNLWHESSLSNQAALFMQRLILNTNTFAGCTINTTFCNPSLGVNGPTLVCANGTYSINNFGATQNVSIQWSFPAGTLAITGGQGTPTVSVSKVTDGNETVTAVLTNTCGQQTTLTLAVRVGIPPTPGITITGIEPLQAGTQMDVRVTTTSAPPYLWYVNNVLVFTASVPSVTINGGNNCNVLNTLKVVVSNTCGTNFATQQYTRPCTGPHFVVAPNPATGMVMVSAIGQGAQTSAQTGAQTESVSKTPPEKAIFEIRVSDQLGKTLKTFSYPSGVSSASLNLSALANGVYVLQIYNNSTWTSQQVIILK